MASNELTSRESASGGRLLVTAAAALFVCMQASRAVAEQSPANLDRP